MKNAACSAVSCLVIGLVVVAWPRSPQARMGPQGAGQTQGGGQSAAQGQGGGLKHPAGTLTPKTLDPGRPWG